MRTKSEKTVRLNTLENLIATKLTENPKWIEAAILALYERQTADEQSAGETTYHNKRGFNSADAKRMSFVAAFLKTGKHLTATKAVTVYGPRLQKYAAQLALVAYEKEQAKKAALEPMMVYALEDENRCPRCNVVRCPDGCCCAC